MKTALVLIDIQNDYFEGGKLPLTGITQATGNAARLLEFFRERNLPVFHIQHMAEQSGAGGFVPGTAGSEIHKSVAPITGEQRIVKHFPSSFKETELLQKLRTAGIERLVFCGAMTHMCVDTTVRVAFELGFADNLLAHDACATMDLQWNDITVKSEQVQAAYMAALGRFAQVMHADGIMDIV